MEGAEKLHYKQSPILLCPTSGIPARYLKYCYEIVISLIQNHENSLVSSEHGHSSVVETQWESKNRKTSTKAGPKVQTLFFAIAVSAAAAASWHRDAGRATQPPPLGAGRPLGGGKLIRNQG